MTGLPRRFDGPRRAAIVSVGSELLLGDLVDTNAAWLSQRLRMLGVEVRHHVTVADDVDQMVGVLHWLAEQVDLIITGGGLGPTADDLTRVAVARAAGVALEERGDLADAVMEVFASRGIRMPARNLVQAQVPAGADAFPPVGTAPAFAVTLQQPGPCRVFSLPGVPWELKALFLRDVEPEVLALAGAGATLTRIIHVVGQGESAVAETVEPLVADADGVTLAFLAKSHEIQVRLTVTADDPDQARQASQPVVDKLVDALGGSVAGIDDETLEDQVLRLLGATGGTVATAESATAGDIAGRLAKVPGASHGLKGGVAVYATDSKRDVLGCDPEVLDRFGPVSKEITVELAANARRLFDADWGVGVTGVAGPEPQNDQPVGTCFWALAHPDGHVEVHGRQIPGDREQVIARLGSAALDLLRRRLLERPAN